MKFEQYIKESNDLVKESSLNRVRKAWSNHDTGTITAFRDLEDCGDGDVITKKEKKRRNYELKAVLLKKGFGVTKVKGAWIENDKEISEDSYFVVDLNDKGNLKKTIIELGKAYEQDAITYADAGGDYYAISTNECSKSWPGFGRIGVEEKLGSPKFGKSGINGFSKVNNRAFVFEDYRLVTITNQGVSEARNLTAAYHKYANIKSIFNPNGEIDE